jgi:hypothetical protein
MQTQQRPGLRMDLSKDRVILAPAARFGTGVSRHAVSAGTNSIY